MQLFKWNKSLADFCNHIKKYEMKFNVIFNVLQPQLATFKFLNVISISKEIFCGFAE